MTDQWFYSTGADRIGPLTSRQLKNLADTNRILRTETIWKFGIEQGVPACKVKYLFPPEIPIALDLPLASLPATHQTPALQTETPVLSPPATVVPRTNSAVPGVHVITDEAKADTLIPASADRRPPTPLAPHDRKGRAIAGKGVVIVFQDGSYVQFKKKCTVCSHEETNRHRLKITSGVTRVNFFCPKCKKLRDGEIRGQMM